jgi:hypothetical protein
MTLSRPRRLTPPAAPGAMLKQFAAPPPKVRLIAPNDAAYLEQVRECPCLSCGLDPCGEAAHVRFASAAYGKSSGLGKRPEHKWAVPLCGSDHRLAKTAQHNRSEQEFWHAIGIHVLATATSLYAQRGDLVAMRAVIFTTIANRSIP